MKSRPLTRSETRDILASKQSIRDSVLVVLMLNTGFRVSEILSIQLEDVINLNVNKGLTLRTKRGKIRTVKLNSSAQKAVKELLQKRKKQGATLKDFLFVGAGRKTHLTRQMAWLLVKKLAKSVLGTAKRISTHSFRKTFATRIYELTKDVMLVKDALDHASVSTTQCYIAGFSLTDELLESLDFN